MPNNLKKPSRPTYIGFTAALAAAAVIGLAYAGTHAASHKPGGGGGGGTAGPSLYLSPSSGNLSAGQTFTVDVHENSGTTGVNAVQANLAYPSDKFTFVSADSSTSGFTISAQSADSGTTVSIARGNIAPLTGDQLVAHVTFTVKGKGSAALTFGAGSALLDAVSNINILASSTAGSYRIR